MSKSKGNFFTFRDLREQGYSPLAIRYLLLSVPTRKQLNFTFEGLQGAESTVERLRSFRQRVQESQPHDFGVNSFLEERINLALREFTEAMDDDFNTANALAAIHNLIRDVNISTQGSGLLSRDKDLLLDTIAKFDSVLGIFGSVDTGSLDAEIEALVEEREE